MTTATPQGAELAARLAQLSPERRALLEKKLREMGAPSRVPEHAHIPRRPGPGPWDVTHGQELLWLVEQVVPNVAYAVPFLFRVRGALDITALRRALDALVARHEALRTRFVDTPQGLRQVIDAPREVPLEELDLRDGPPAGREDAARQVLRDRLRRPFDLGADLMLRAHIVHVSGDESLLLLLTHHIVSDEASRYVVHGELSALYDAALDGRDAALPPLPIQYADYAAWQRAALGHGRLAEQVAYWHGQLRDAQPLVLPTDHPRPPMPSFEGALRRHTFPAAKLDAVEKLGREHGTTTFMTMGALFAVLLHRMSGQDDIVVGSPVTSRRFVELEGLIGYFPNVVALRTRFSGDPAFTDVLRATRETALDALERCDVPLETIALELRRDSRQALEPLFRVAFVLQSPDRTDLRLRGATVSTELAEPGTAKFDITWFVTAGAGELTVTCEYRTDLYEGATIDRMFAQFETLLDDAVRRPHLAVSRLALLPEAERRLVVEEWNATRTAYPRDALVHELFAACAARHPGTVAVVDGSASLAYGDLDARADAVARGLTALGIGAGDRVALFAERSASLVTAMLGVFKAGAAYVPLEPEYPAARLLFMLQDSGARVVVVQRHLESAFAEVLHGGDPATVAALRSRIAWLDAAGHLTGEEPGRAGAPRDARAPAAGTEAAGDPGSRAAYVMYTSGSTGTPKGVVVAHRGIVRLVQGTNYMRFTPDDVMLGFAPTAFDASTLEVWGPLLNGGRLVLAPARLINLAELAEFVEHHGVTSMFLSAALFHQVVEAGLDRYGSVTQLLAGGDVVSAPHALRALEALPGCQVINGYGPTENTTFTCCYSVPRNWPAGEAIPIGRPIANTRVYVLDAHGAPVPIGVAGELHAGGDGVALGYLDRPALTAERFVADPFSDAPGARLYRTGDRVRWRADGAIDFLGRADDQVKIRGFRVEPGEVEATLAALPGIGGAAVVVRADASGQKRLIAYVLPAPGSDVNLADLRASLRTRLPAHMIPASIVPVAEFPRTANGKLDRSALPEPSATTVDPGDLARPHTLTQKRISDIWESLLAHRPIGINDDFFEIGGHSLVALRMLAEVERALGRRVPLRTLFKAATIRGLADAVDAALYAEPETVVVLQPGVSQAPLFFAHGDVLGAGWYCRRLATLLSPSLPFVVLPTLRGNEPGSPLTIEAMATAHLRTVRQVQPRGPYRVGGFCAGGLIALEMARELGRQGEAVEHLIMIDAVNRNAQLGWLRGAMRAIRADADATRLARVAALLQALQYYASRLDASKHMEGLQRARWAFSAAKRALLGRLARSAPVLPPATDDTLIPSEHPEAAAALRELTRAVVTYMPLDYAGALDLIFATNLVDARGSHLAHGWDRVSPNVRAHFVPGTHLSIIGEDIGALAECMRACLGIEPTRPSAGGGA